MSLFESNKKSFLYKEAYSVAPPDVKRLIEEFRGLPKKVKEKTPLLYYILNSGTPPYKMSKEDSHYREIKNGNLSLFFKRYEENTKKLSSLANLSFKNNRCLNCIFYYVQPKRDFAICSQIRGKVKPEGWCNQFRGEE